MCVFIPPPCFRCAEQNKTSTPINATTCPSCILQLLHSSTQHHLPSSRNNIYTHQDPGCQAKMQNIACEISLHMTQAVSLSLYRSDCVRSRLLVAQVCAHTCYTLCANKATATPSLGAQVQHSISTLQHSNVCLPRRNNTCTHQHKNFYLPRRNRANRPCREFSSLAPQIPVRWQFCCHWLTCHPQVSGTYCDR